MVKLEILKKPLLSEKANAMNEAGKYAFIVDIKANKIEIKNAIEKMYGVTVESVNTIRYMGKPKARYSSARIVSGRTPSYKKAIITVAEGEFIDIYGNI